MCGFTFEDRVDIWQGKSDKIRLNAQSSPFDMSRKKEGEKCDPMLAEIWQIFVNLSKPLFSKFVAKTVLPCMYYCENVERGAGKEVRKSCRSQKILQNEYLLFSLLFTCKIGLDAAENGPSKAPTRRPKSTYAYLAFSTLSPRSGNIRVNRTKMFHLILARRRQFQSIKCYLRSIRCMHVDSTLKMRSNLCAIV